MGSVKTAFEGKMCSWVGIVLCRQWSGALSLNGMYFKMKRINHYLHNYLVRIPAAMSA